MTELKTKIGLEIHVQLKTKSKMFCRCDNNAEGKAPNSVVCPVCLGLPGALPVANCQAIEWTIKTGLALNCEIPKIAKFDRKHYFYPDLPKGYQISQYDEPFCVGGFVEINGHKVRLNRIHLEEDAGKLIHAGNKSLVDLNRAGTPLMEIVTEPDILTPEMAAEFLRKLQKIVRDVVSVSEASMEKGHMRCDANISVNDGDKMSPIIELKNINSFKFVEKALILVQEKLNNDYGTWPEKNSKETWGYNSENNSIYLQRRKEEAADYRYFPEPDLPPVDSTVFDLSALKSEISQDEDSKIVMLVGLGVSEFDAKVIAGDATKWQFYQLLCKDLSDSGKIAAAKAIVHNYFGFVIHDSNFEFASDFAKAVEALAENKIQKSTFAEIASRISDEKIHFDSIANEYISTGLSETEVSSLIEKIIEINQSEADRYKAGEKQLIGFFMGEIMKETKGKADPSAVNKILREKL